MAVCALAGCKAPSINLTTAQPIKVDIDMRLDVYQHSPDSNGQASPLATPKPSASASERRKDRAADIQVFKNSGAVGEGHDGLLVILSAPDGGDGDELRHIVAAENAARLADMKAAASKQKIPLTEVQSTQAELWRNRAFKGEWFEEKQADGGYRWVQKKG
jgi:uncharacterized protein YdbL (DUF1318 family)